MSKEAVQAHQHGDIVKAKQLYQEAYDASEKTPVLYQNYGALLRQDANNDLALQVYSRGLGFFPHHLGILSNAANLCWDINRKTTALELNLRALAITLSNQRSEPKEVKQLDTLSDQIYEQLADLECYQLGFSLLPTLLAKRVLDCRFLLTIRLFYSKHSQLYPTDHSTLIIEELDKLLNSKLDSADPVVRMKMRLLLTHTAIDECGIDESAKQFTQLEQQWKEYSLTDPQSGKSIEQLWCGNAWNFSNSLLQHQRFEMGWRLFDYGLVTSAQGKQKWQRALKKPFPYNILPLWEGQALQGQSLLLLEEQAIGDVMMFLTIIPSLLNEASKCLILINPRLMSIYKRSFSQYILDGKLELYNSSKSSKFPDPATINYQVPMGSVFKHRFTKISQYAPITPILRSNSNLTDRLIDQYDQRNSKKAALRIGLSWRGGGFPKRQLQKSISIKLLADALKEISSSVDVQFISLQYGDIEADIKSFESFGVSVLHDQSINPMKDMDSWLSQVQACDAVISIANTTIHGSGGLGIPTACLLSHKFDWRWLVSDKPLRSYWYSSVISFRQKKNDDWTDALNQLTLWVLQGCKSPTDIPCSIE